MLSSVSQGINTAAQFVTVLLIFVFVLAITYATTRWIANYQKSRNFAKNIEAVETYQIAPNKYIQIVKVGEKYLAIGVCKDSMTLLKELEPEEIQLPENSISNTLTFKEVLEKAKNLKQKK